MEENKLREIRCREEAEEAKLREIRCREEAEEAKLREIRCREEAEEARWQKRRDERRRLEMEEEERWRMKREEWKQELAHQNQEHSFDLFNSPCSSPLLLPSPLQFTIGCSPQERTSTPQCNLESRITAMEDSILSIKQMLMNICQTPTVNNNPLTPSNTDTVVNTPVQPISSKPVGEMVYQIPAIILEGVKNGCRSRRNLAGRLTMQLFSQDEKETSNFRGVLGKAKLDHIKTDGIRRTCLDVFPPKQYETPQMIDREIREGIDEMCRRTKRKLPVTRSTNCADRA